jgi:hypothetical protein
VKRKMDRRRVRKFENCKKENNTDELTPKRFKKKQLRQKKKLISLFFFVTRGH